MARSLLDKHTKKAQTPEKAKHEFRVVPGGKPQEKSSRLTEADWYHVHNFWKSSLFHELYLRDDFQRARSRDLQDYEAGFQVFLGQFLNLCDQKRNEKFHTWNEDQTVRSWIMPVLETLGWWDPSSDPVIPELTFTVSEQNKKRTYRPDCVFVPNQKVKGAIQEKEASERIEFARRYVILTLEAKFWDRLRKYDKTDGQPTSGDAQKSRHSDSASCLSPGGQILTYLRHLRNDDPARNHFGIVTDGKVWRLHHVDSPESKFFEFDLGDLLFEATAGGKDVTDLSGKQYTIIEEAARYFYYFFSKAALYSEKNEPTIVDDVYEYSKKYVERAEQNLKLRFLNAMKHACNGFYRASKASGEKMDLTAVRDLAESHIFNILFLKSCEAKGAIRYEANTDVSITSIIERISHYDPNSGIDDETNETLNLGPAFKEFEFRNEAVDLHKKILTLTDLVQNGGRLSSGLEISAFKETIYSNREKALVAKFPLSNIETVRLLFELGYMDDEGKFRQIPYNVFTPEQLGSIYESFLEYRLEHADEDMEFLNKQWKPISKKTADKLRTNQSVSHPIARRGELYFTPDNAERKASGSYYTPDYIVRYMVERTLGEQCDGKTPNEILSLKICDPAMGSGHFLAGALRYISERCLEAMEREAAFKQKPLQIVKREVLENCIFGVDMNPRAVRLARMALWLETACAGMKLEELDDQLKCGNSIFEKMNSDFSWREFLKSKAIEKFDAIVGNPPYFNVDEQFGYASKEGKYLKAEFQDVYQDKTDIMFYFCELAIRHSQRFAFILKRTFLEADKGQKLRARIATSSCIHELVDFGDYEVFWPEASINSAIIVASVSETKDPDVSLRIAIAKNSERDNGEYGAEVLKTLSKKSPSAGVAIIEANPSELHSGPWTFQGKSEQKVKSRLEENTVLMEDLFDLAQGMQTGANSVYGDWTSKRLKDSGIPQKFCRRLIRNSDIHPFHIQFGDSYSIYVEDIDAFSNVPAPIQRLLTAHKEELKDRSTVKNEGHPWFLFTRALGKKWYDEKRDRLIVPYRASCSRFAFIPSGEHISYTDTTVMFPKFKDRKKLISILAVLNSPVVEYLYQWIGKPTGSGMREYFKTNISRIPVRIFTSAQQTELYDLLWPYIEKNESVPESVVEKVNVLILKFYGVTKKELVSA